MKNSNFIVKNPEMYLETQGKVLDQRLKDIKIDEGKVQELIFEKGVTTIRDKVLGLFKLGEIINTILSFSDETNEIINNAKKDTLLEYYLNIVDNHEAALNELKLLLTSKYGLTLFNKINKILDNNPPDAELTRTLAYALKHIIDNNDFDKMFERHKFALEQIEMLPIQALAILSDYKNFPGFSLEGISYDNSRKVTSEWNNEFVKAYCKHKGITSNDKIIRVSHVIKQLQVQGYLAVFKPKEFIFYCEVTNIGKDLLPYININMQQ